MSTGKEGPSVHENGRPFYRIVPAAGGLADIWLSPGEAVPMMDDLTGRMDYNFRVHRPATAAVWLMSDDMLSSVWRW